MRKALSEFGEDVLLGRAFLPVYAMLAQQNNSAPLIPPIAFRKNPDNLI